MQDSSWSVERMQLRSFEPPLLGSETQATNKFGRNS
jgi:hypothetical protein